MKTPTTADRATLPTDVESSSKRVPMNPISEKIEALTRPTANKICNAIDEVTPRIMFEHNGFLPFRSLPGASMEYRAATNEECAEFKVEWCDVRATLDLRKDLSKQVAEWLREMAALMIGAADAVEAVKDKRNLNRICAIVGATPKDSVEAA